MLHKMDLTEFTDSVLANYTLTDGEVSLAVTKAESEAKITVSQMSSGTKEFLWLANRTERHAIWILLKKSAEEYNYSPSGNRSEIFSHYKEMLAELDKEWKDIYLPQIKAKNGNPFQVVEPGFRYTKTGRPK